MTRADLHRSLPLRTCWPERIKSALVHAVSLARGDTYNTRGFDKGYVPSATGLPSSFRGLAAGSHGRDQQAKVY